MPEAISFWLYTHMFTTMCEYALRICRIGRSGKRPVRSTYKIAVGVSNFFPAHTEKVYMTHSIALLRLHTIGID
jgi:hypothetical protein